MTSEELWRCQSIVVQGGSLPPKLARLLLAEMALWRKRATDLADALAARP
jgi:hypothetical protein